MYEALRVFVRPVRVHNYQLSEARAQRIDFRHNLFVRNDQNHAVIRIIYHRAFFLPYSRSFFLSPHFLSHSFLFLSLPLFHSPNLSFRPSVHLSLSFPTSRSVSIVPFDFKPAVPVLRSPITRVSSNPTVHFRLSVYYHVQMDSFHHAILRYVLLFSCSRCFKTAATKS